MIELSSKIQRYSKSDYTHYISSLKRLLTRNIGNHAIFVQENKRTHSMTLVEILDVSNYYVSLRYKVYDNYGRFRQYIYTTASFDLLYSKQERLIILSNI